MSKYDDLPVEVVRKVLRYDAASGKLFWLERPVDFFEDRGGRYTAERSARGFNSKHAGKEALTAKASNGYLVGGILGRVYSAHRVCWAIHHGSWPSGDLDHINRIRHDNRIENLRLATRALNGHNKVMPNKHSPYVGVTWYKPTSKWVARVTKDRKVYQLGYFDDIEEAVRARDLKARELYGGDAFQNCC